MHLEHSHSVVDNADLWRVTFIDAEGAPTVPDGDVTWTVKRPGRPVEVIRQERAGATYELVIVPDRPAPYSVKVSATVLGVPQATEEVRRRVVP